MGRDPGSRKGARKVGSGLGWFLLRAGRDCSLLAKIWSTWVVVEGGCAGGFQGVVLGSWRSSPRV